MILNESLQNYLTDLGLMVPETPTIEFVKQLQAKHIERYSFNSLAVILGEDISLDLEMITQKIVTRGLGGYCFEHNKLTFELLKALGYDVQLKMARVLNNNLDRKAGRTHRITLVTIDGMTYVIDTGFGGSGPISPLLLSAHGQQKSGLDSYRIVAREHGEFDLQLLVEGGDNFTLYRFDNAIYTDADCELGHFYSHQNPNAVFVKNLMVTLKKQDKTFALLNTELITRDKHKEQKLLITTAKMLEETLFSVFNIFLEPVLVEHLFDRFLADKLVEQDGELPS
ncbi:arylamine N-acetyltransferase family protein [Marinomonas transparens]|uniref:Arylamine N-acetyltransferase n=1 Tax=Marinomonas transparens TaxID=2795388 RepID=A0A934JW14_9GAMM|nr:arylamine N-acetyltransferase [Marinomonas transparens]MBJ7539421.1 arylamine N-acetyltransferase [Marinomonas transparens]